MIPTKLAPLIFAALLVLVAGGCANPSRSTALAGRSGSFQRTRAPEELRVYEGPLSITVDAENGYGSLEIPQTGKRPLSLFIADEHLAKLETTDKALRHEVRYWYRDERWSSVLVIGQGELVSVRNSSGVILDLSRCTRHETNMVRRPVPIVYGLPMGDFLKAMNRDFPHPAFELGGCVIDDGGPKRRAPLCLRPMRRRGQSLVRLLRGRSQVGTVRARPGIPLRSSS
jgi:hypothetical protein